MQDGARSQHRKINDGAERDGGRSPAGAKGWCMNPLVETFEPQGADSPGKRKSRPEEDEKGCQQGSPRGQVSCVRHSMTSPRMRNLASATLETKPSTAMISAASK